MKLLIDILHPAHVHFFRNFYTEMIERGHELLITARAKEISLELLENYGLPFKLISRQKTGTLGLASEMIKRTYRLSQIVGEFQPDAMTGIMGPSIAVAGALHRVPAVVFYDTEFAAQTNWFTYPLAHSVCTPDCYQRKVPGTHVTYAGYHELAYLHPNRFTPDPEKLSAFASIFRWFQPRYCPVTGGAPGWPSPPCRLSAALAGRIADKLAVNAREDYMKTARGQYLGELRAHKLSDL